MNTEITGGIAEGTVIVSEMTVGTDAAAAADESSSSTETNPFAPTPPGSKKNK
jgi:hypothetical protein